MIPLAADLAVVTLKALLRYRERVDEILALNEAQRGLPFRLPPAPTDVASHFAPMLDYFERSETGRAALVLQGLGDDFDAVARATGAPPQAAVNRLFALYFELAEIQPRRLAPGESDVALRVRAGSGPSETMRLAYYVVESHRLSRNPAWTRLLLAAADTLLETLGQNAGLFVSDPRTRGFVETLLQEFAGKHDFDDDGAERIARRLLGSAAIAAFEQRGRIPERPALAALAGALGDVYAELRSDPALDAADFFAGLLQGDRFDRLVSTFLTHVADDPRFLASHALARDVVTATLRHVAKDVPSLRTQPEAVLGALEVALAAGASHVDALLVKRLDGTPAAALVLGAVARAVETSAGQHDLFRAVARGDVVASLYGVALRAIAERPEALVPGADAGVAELVGGVAGALAAAGPAAALDRETLRAAVSSCLDALARHPTLVARDASFAGRIVGAVCAAAAPLAADGIGLDDLAIVADAAVRASAETPGVAGDGALGAALGAAAQALAQDGVRALLDADARRETLLAVVSAVASNPALWSRLGARDAIAPLAGGIVSALASGGAGALAGPGLAEAIERCLHAVSQHGAALAAGDLDAEAVQRFVSRALEHGAARLGRGLDVPALPELVALALAGQLESDPAVAPPPGLLDDALARVVARL